MMEVRANVAITDEQRKILEIVARTASTLSALGVITIITVFSLARHFRNPMHRLIFINAFYNALDVVCTMISISGPAAGNDSALCQFQGFLNQMCVPIRRTILQRVLTTTGQQVSSRRCILDACHGCQCLSHCFPSIRYRGIEEA